MRLFQPIKNLIFLLTLVPVFYLCLVTYWLMIRMQRKRYHRLHPEAKPRLIWGDHPLMNNQYWSDAMQANGYHSETLMKWHMNYQNRTTFDGFTDELKVTGIGKIDQMLLNWFRPIIAFTYAVKRADIFHHHFYGGFLCNTWMRPFEAQLLHWFGCKVVITGVGGDLYCNSTIRNQSIKTGFLINYPGRVWIEKQTERNIKYWALNADCVIVGFQIDAMPRWDVMPMNMIVVDTDKIQPKAHYSDANGKNGVVKVIHAPNHRGIKGTEFLVRAVEELQQEGLQVELILLENVQNEEVLRLMREEADILVEQLYWAYALTSMEGFATGLPVLGNLEEYENALHIFRRFSYLNECPMLSTTPENVKDQLRMLVTRPDLREALGRACRAYGEKYHSPAKAQFMYGKVYDKIWYGKEVELMTLFHPLLGEYKRDEPPIQHPLVNNHVPADYLSMVSDATP
ncbi:MAG: hypothetical protein ACFB10_11360 [Salibacteraceae bacterium]